MCDTDWATTEGKAVTKISCLEESQGPMQFL